jgi:hypothetical protein
MEPRPQHPYPDAPATCAPDAPGRQPELTPTPPSRTAPGSPTTRHAAHPRQEVRALRPRSKTDRDARDCSSASMEPLLPHYSPPWKKPTDQWCHEVPAASPFPGRLFLSPFFYKSHAHRAFPTLPFARQSRAPSLLRSPSSSVETRRSSCSPSAFPAGAPSAQHDDRARSLDRRTLPARRRSSLRISTNPRLKTTPNVDLCSKSSFELIYESCELSL